MCQALSRFWEFGVNQTYKVTVSIEDVTDKKKICK